MADYFLCDWRVKSDFPFPELAIWDGDEKIPDIVIRRLTEDPGTSELIAISPILQVRADGLSRLEIPKIATYFVLGGRFVGVICHEGGSDLDVRYFFFAAILGIICHQRGLLPLRGTCIRVGRGAIAFIGPSTLGKTALAVGLALRGYELLSDDVSIFNVGRDSVQLIPAVRRAKIWNATLRALEIPSSQWEHAREVTHEYVYNWPVPPNTEWAGVDLTRIYFFDRAIAGKEKLQPLTQEEARNWIYSFVCQDPFVRHFGLTRRIQYQALCIANRIPCLRWARDLLVPLQTSVSTMEELMRS